MRESIKFSHYGFMPGDEIAIEWGTVLPNYLNRYSLIIDADYEPEDKAVQVGVLRAAWFGHEVGCLIVSRGGLSVNRRFAVSTDPLIGEEALAA